MIFRVILYGFLIYILYKIVFQFIVPIYRTSQKIKSGLRETHQRMSEQMQSNETKPSGTPGKNMNPKVNEEDYIEFEEIK